MSEKPTSVRVEKKGSFNDDAFFKDSVASWEQAMKEVVSRWDTGSRRTKTVQSSSETTRTYRDIRAANLTTDDSQAVSISEEDDSFKIVIDVKDFRPEDISVKVVEDKIVVEGSLERQEGRSVSSQQFVRRFMLPPNADCAKVTSALSRDGVLKVICPKYGGGQGKRGSVSVQTSNGKEKSPERRPSCDEGTFNDQQRRGTLTTHREEWDSSSDDDDEYANAVAAVVREVDEETGRQSRKATVTEPPVIMFGPPPKGCITSKNPLRKA